MGGGRFAMWWENVARCRCCDWWRLRIRFVRPMEEDVGFVRASSKLSSVSLVCLDACVSTRVSTRFCSCVPMWDRDGKRGSITTDTFVHLEI